MCRKCFDLLHPEDEEEGEGEGERVEVVPKLV